MKAYNIKLPSNKKFGYFFSTIFLIAATYFFYIKSQAIGYVLIVIGLLFLVITLTNAGLLLPLNQLWMRFGLLLGKIINPIIMGIIFFGLFVPYGLVIRLIGRDELNLKQVKNKIYWKLRSKELSQINFKRQF